MARNCHHRKEENEQSSEMSVESLRFAESCERQLYYRLNDVVLVKCQGQTRINGVINS